MTIPKKSLSKPYVNDGNFKVCVDAKGKYFWCPLRDFPELRVIKSGISGIKALRMAQKLNGIHLNTPENTPRTPQDRRSGVK